MKMHRFAVSATLGLATVALVVACGGGGDSAVPAPAPVVVQTAVLEGTAATGSALANAQVAIVNGSGAAACQEASIVTSGTGKLRPAP